MILPPWQGLRDDQLANVKLLACGECLRDNCCCQEELVPLSSCPTVLRAMDFPEAAHQKTPNYKTTHSPFISSVSLTENYEEGILVESFIPSYK